MNTEQENNQKALSDFAEELRIPKPTLSFWKKRGLIVPVGRAGKTDLFEWESTLQTIKQIKQYQSQGKTLDEIGTIIRNTSDTNRD